MIVTNGKIVDIVVNSSDVNEALSIIDTIIFLLDKHGKNLRSKAILDIIKQESEDIYSFIVLFDKLGKLNKRELNKIILGIKNKYPSYKKTFGVSSSKDTILKKSGEILTQEFGQIYLNENINDELGLSIKGEGLYFKRNLENDLNKLLD